MRLPEADPSKFEDTIKGGYIDGNSDNTTMLMESKQTLIALL